LSDELRLYFIVNLISSNPDEKPSEWDKKELKLYIGDKVTEYRETEDLCIYAIKDFIKLPSLLGRRGIEYSVMFENLGEETKTIDVTVDITSRFIVDKRLEPKLIQPIYLKQQIS
jgi:hypothetical protein